MHFSRFKKQLEFIIEIDKVKSIFRRTRLFDSSRHENDSEHAWHLSMMAMILSEYSNAEIDLLRVIKMLLIHDIVEIDAGDTFLYDENRDDAFISEEKAAKRIFGLLPDDQAEEFYSLWREFEEKNSNEARFAGALDRLEPVMQNYFNHGYAWNKHMVRSSQVLEKNSCIKDGSQHLWKYACNLIAECVEKGYIDNYGEDKDK